MSDPVTETITVSAWTDVVRRARLGRTLTGIAVIFGTYADFETGRSCHPGVARLSVECEVTYKVAKRAIAKLRSLGLIELVRRSRRRGEADDYRLILAPDILERLTVLDPAQVALEAERVRDRERRQPRKPGPDGDGGRSMNGADDPTEVRDGEEVQGSASPVRDASEIDVRVTANPVEPVDNSEVRGTRDPVLVDGADRCTGNGNTATGGCTGYGVPKVRGTPYPTTSQRPLITATTQTQLPVDGDHQAAREDAENRDSRVIEQEGQSPRPAPLPDRCPHGLRARRRPDGSSSCALCRHEAARADPPPRPGPTAARTAAA